MSLSHYCLSVTRQFRAKRASSLFKDVPLRTRRALSLCKVYRDGDSGGVLVMIVMGLRLWYASVVVGVVVLVVMVEMVVDMAVVVLMMVVVAVVLP